MSRIAESQAPGETSGFDDVVGIWFNTNRVAPDIVRVEISHDNGSLMIRAFGSNNGAPTDWGRTHVIPHRSPDEPGAVTGFEACFQAAGIERRLAGNLKLGVLVIQCYNHIDDSPDGGHFTREFFHQRFTGNHVAVGDPESSDDSAPICRATDDRPLAEAVPPAASVNLEPYLGIWRNTNRHTSAASQLVLLRDSIGYLVHTSSDSAPGDWGYARAVAYAADDGSRRPAAFFVDYDLGFMQARLAANFNKGLLIVAAYHLFKDDRERANTFTREFFYQDRP